MAQYYVKTENSRGNIVTAMQHLFARATLQTLAPGVTKFSSARSEDSQVSKVNVTLERLGARSEDGRLTLTLDLRSLPEDVEIFIHGASRIASLNGYRLT